MGGRTERNASDYSDREIWITEVSDARLSNYERLMDSSAAPWRADGSSRGDKGEYFRDLIAREKARRNS